jgi:hypothetical protein
MTQVSPASVLVLLRLLRHFGEDKRAEYRNHPHSSSSILGGSNLSRHGGYRWTNNHVGRGTLHMQCNRSGWLGNLGQTDGIDGMVADFVQRRLSGIAQRPTILRSPNASGVGRRDTPQRVLNLHVMYFHPVTWDDFLAYRRDVREHWKIWDQE